MEYREDRVEFGQESDPKFWMGIMGLTIERVINEAGYVHASLITRRIQMDRSSSRV